MDDPCPGDIFANKETACDWLCKFVCETKGYGEKGVRPLKRLW